MKVIDFINGHNEFDGALWFFNGQYVGHDDQIGEYDFAPEGTEQAILFRHRIFKDGTTYEDVEPFLGAKALTEIEHLLVPIANSR